MPTITQITPCVATTSQLDKSDFAQIAAMGFKSVINSRPDTEDGGLIGSRAARAEAAKAGLSYAYVPAPGHAMFDDVVLDAFDDALRALPGPVLAHCHTGTRSAILWALVSARTAPVKSIVRTLSDTGLDVAFLEPQLHEQAAAHRGKTDIAATVLEKGGDSPCHHVAVPGECGQSSRAAA